MNTDLARLLDLPATARLAAVGDELTLLTLTHEHADKLVIERRRLGPSIDLGELLQIVGLHGLAEAPQIQVSEVAAPQLPAPVEEHAPAVTCPQCARTFKDEHGLKTHVAMKHREQAPAAIAPTARRTTRNAVPSGFPCPDCERTFKNPHARVVHQGRAHKPVAAPEAVEQEPEPEPESVPAVEPEPAPEVTPEPVAAPTVPLRAYTCTACDTPLADHERCRDCQALLGPGHDAGMAHMVVNGSPLCRLCFEWRGSARQTLKTPR